jgi:Arc/MetJ-type ribon-helix-helix transcriptional regulator
MKMSSQKLSPETVNLIAEELARGKYKSEDEVVREGVKALIERREASEGIRRGLADMKAGRMRSRKAFDKAFRKRNGLA